MKVIVTMAEQMAHLVIGLAIGIKTCGGTKEVLSKTLKERVIFPSPSLYCLDESDLDSLVNAVWEKEGRGTVGGESRKEEK